MKTLIAASLLLALVVPAHASKFRDSDRKWLPMVDRLGDEASWCLRGPADDEARVEKSCKAMNKLIKKLEARGYCYYAMGGIGRPSKDRKHCYIIDWPFH